MTFQKPVSIHNKAVSLWDVNAAREAVLPASVEDLVARILGEESPHEGKSIARMRCMLRSSLVEHPDGRVAATTYDGDTEIPVKLYLDALYTTFTEDATGAAVQHCCNSDALCVRSSLVAQVFPITCWQEKMVPRSVPVTAVHEREHNFATLDGVGMHCTIAMPMTVRCMDSYFLDKDLSDALYDHQRSLSQMQRSMQTFSSCYAGLDAAERASILAAYELQRETYRICVCIAERVAKSDMLLFDTRISTKQRRSARGGDPLDFIVRPVAVMTFRDWEVSKADQDLHNIESQLARSSI